MKQYFEQVTQLFLSALLEREPDKRLGKYQEGQEDDATDIRAHPYFQNIDWHQIKQSTHNAPFVPKTKGPMDTSKIDSTFTNEALDETYVDPKMQNLGLNED